MKKLQLLAIGFIFSVGLAVAQPPPPHPGGSGNQGADIPVLPAVACMILLGTAMKMYGIRK